MPGTRDQGKDSDTYFLITVGGTEMKAYQTTTSWLLALGAVFLLLLIVGLLLLVGIYASRSLLSPFVFTPAPPLPPASLGLQSSPGSLSGGQVSAGGGEALSQAACQAAPHAEWFSRPGITGICHCTDQYWGPSCSLPGVQADFYAAGGPGASGLSLQPLAPAFFSSNLSLGPSPCTPACASRPDCAGVLYAPGSCTLLAQVDLAPQGALPYDPLAPSSLFLKRARRPRVHGQVWLAADASALPLRPWLANSWGSPPSFARLLPLTLTSLPFHPRLEANADNLPGVFSDGRFSEAEARAALALARSRKASVVGVNGRTFYVRDGGTSATNRVDGMNGTNFSVPLAWRHTLPLFAMYLWG